MSQRTIAFNNETTRKFVANQQRGPEYNATIQNLSGQSITITVTNDDIQDTNATFDTPAAGALVIADGAIGSLTQPNDGWLITAAMAATGNVLVVEAG